MDDTHRRTDLLSRKRACIHLGPGNPNVHKEVGNPKVSNQVEGIVLSHVGWLGRAYMTLELNAQCVPLWLKG